VNRLHDRSGEPASRPDWTKVFWQHVPAALDLGLRAFEIAFYPILFLGLAAILLFN
jgi:hypothetical protein